MLPFKFINLAKLQFKDGNWNTKVCLLANNEHKKKKKQNGKHAEWFLGPFYSHSGK